MAPSGGVGSFRSWKSTSHEFVYKLLDLIAFKICVNLSVRIENNPSVHFAGEIICNLEVTVGENWSSRHPEKDSGRDRKDYMAPG